MKRFVTVVSVGLLALGVCTYAAVDWAQDYKSALERAGKEKKLLMVDLYADWCGPCKMLDRLTFSNADVQAALSKDFVAVKVNIEGSKENRDLAVQLNTEAIPHVIFFDSSGKKLSEIVGFVPADQFRDELRKAAEKAAKK
ncbi:MAG: thioredoxin family protein [Verrucomicrobiia bacterium]|jgi:thiol:disulfide interchange protein